MTDLKLNLSSGRNEDATESIEAEIIKRATAVMESIKDPEALLSMRKTLRSEVIAHDEHIKKQKTSHAKINKQRTQALAQWNGFVTGIIELIRKYGIETKELPLGMSHGVNFAERLKNLNPDSFPVTIEGLRIPQIKIDGLLDDDRIKLFEAKVQTDVLEKVIQRKAQAMRELFSDGKE